MKNKILEAIINIVVKNGVLFEMVDFETDIKIPKADTIETKPPNDEYLRVISSRDCIFIKVKAKELSVTLMRENEK